MCADLAASGRWAPTEVRCLLAVLTQLSFSSHVSSSAHAFINPHSIPPSSSTSSSCSYSLFFSLSHMDISSTKTMRKLEVILLLLLLVFIISPIVSTEANSIPFLLTDPEQGKSDDGLAKMDGVTQLYQSGEMEGEGTDWNNMMGMELEQCSDEVDECLKRRLISEAHLDYIYTQHQKP